MLFLSCFQAMYGVFFADNQEAAFSNYRLWESLGFVIAFAYANFLCIKVKLIILLVVLIISLVGYFIAEYINQMQVDREYAFSTGIVLQDVHSKDEKAWKVHLRYDTTQKYI